MIRVRTDLALESTEQLSGEDTVIKGVAVREEYDEATAVKITRIAVLDKNGEKAIRRPIGNYITIEALNLVYDNDALVQYITGKIAFYLDIMLERIIKNQGKSYNDRIKVLVAGLGNRYATADALGPEVVNIMELDEYMSAIAPGVMAQTGMETADILRGIAMETKADVIIAVDSLAARSSRRINTTIQLSDTGIMPGSGVGNHRQGLDEKTMGVPVIAIGVPTVIDAPTIVNDAFENFFNVMGQYEVMKDIGGIFEAYTNEEKYSLVKEIMDPYMSDMYVTPKDVDENIRKLSRIVALGINAIQKKSHLQK